MILLSIALGIMLDTAPQVQCYIQLIRCNVRYSSSGVMLDTAPQV